MATVNISMDEYDEYKRLKKLEELISNILGIGWDNETIFLTIDSKTVQAAYQDKNKASKTVKGDDIIDALENLYWETI